MSDETEVTPTSDDAGGTDDAIAAFVSGEDDAPEEREENQPLPRKDAPAAKPKKTTAKLDEEPEPKPDNDEKPEPEKPPEKRVYKQRVMGEERELDADQLDGIAKALGVEPKELLSAASLKRASYEKMREAAEARKQVEQAQALAKSDPLGALKMLGLTPEEFDKYAQQHVYQRFASEYDPATGQPLTPEQRRLHELEGREQERLRVEQEAKHQTQEQEEAKTRAEQERHWIKTIVTHLEKSGDPKHILPRVAAHLGDAIENDAGTDPADLLDDAVSLAWDDVQAEHSKLYEAMPYQTLRARFPSLVEKVRKGLVDEWKARAGQKAPERQPETVQRSSGRKTRTTADVFADFVSGR